MNMMAVTLLMAGWLAQGTLAQSAGERGQFWRVHWYERGLEHANPAYEGRFRVNSPEVVLHPTFGSRVEARENGLMLIRAEEDLSQITASEIYLEMWGGHPGTANKRVTINGRSTYFLPRVGTEEMNCTYQYPTIPLRITDLVNGYDALQFAVDQGATFWGHMLVDNAAIRVALAKGHPDLVKAGLAHFQATANASASRPDQIELAVRIASGSESCVESVEFEGFYFGYDENGDGRTTDWHGFTKARKPVAILGSSSAPTTRVIWDTSMLPSQKNVGLRAVLHFKGQSNLLYVTAPQQGIAIAERPDRQVTLYASHDLPAPFWSRANQKRECTIYLDVNPSRIERAELHVNTWAGGAGGVREYFKINGRHFPVAEGTKHELVYSRLAVDPAILKQGINRIELLSDTEHHGIEILLPGPCLMVRSR